MGMLDDKATLATDAGGDSWQAANPSPGFA